jgi:dienelactone hydrolase
MRRVLLLVIFATLICNAPALAGSLVGFSNLPGREPKQLIGYLARPDTGLSALIGTTPRNVLPYPAVVVLHGCGGISSHSAAIADRLGGWGYVALAIDSLGGRGLYRGCNSGTYRDQAFDAYAGLRYLSTRDDVDAERVALFGQSMGGSAALYAIDRDLAASYFVQRFHTVIAYYPRCAVASVPAMTAPVLILIGEADQWNPADACKALKKSARSDDTIIDLTVYPGVHHAFDVEQLKPGRNIAGLWLEFDEAAARDAEEKPRAFLGNHLARQPATMTAPKHPSDGR